MAAAGGGGGDRPPFQPPPHRIHYDGPRRNNRRQGRQPREPAPNDAPVEVVPQQVPPPAEIPAEEGDGPRLYRQEELLFPCQWCEQRFPTSQALGGHIRWEIERYKSAQRSGAPLPLRPHAPFLRRAHRRPRLDARGAAGPVHGRQPPGLGLGPPGVVPGRPLQHPPGHPSMGQAQNFEPRFYSGFGPSSAVGPAMPFRIRHDSISIRDYFPGHAGGNGGQRQQTTGLPVQRLHPYHRLMQHPHYLYHHGNQRPVVPPPFVPPPQAPAPPSPPLSEPQFRPPPVTIFGQPYQPGPYLQQHPQDDYNHHQGQNQRYYHQQRQLQHQPYHQHEHRPHGRAPEQWRLPQTQDGYDEPLSLSLNLGPSWQHQQQQQQPDDDDGIDLELHLGRKYMV